MVDARCGGVYLYLLSTRKGQLKWNTYGIVMDFVKEECDSLAKVSSVSYCTGKLHKYSEFVAMFLPISRYDTTNYIQLYCYGGAIVQFLFVSNGRVSIF